MKRGWKTTAATLFVLSLAALGTMILAACGTTAAPTPASMVEAYASDTLDTSYEGALPASSQLLLGTLLLEGTPHAVTPEQAGALLPLWQALQGTALQNQSEVSAVLGQIERSMTAEQLQSIAAMQLTQEGLTDWAQERGVDMAQWADRPDRTPGAGAGGAAEAWPGRTPGAGGQGNLDPEARETMRAGLDAMSDEERAQLLATRQAGGIPAGGLGGRAGQGQPGANTGQFRFLLPPLIELLTQRAASL